MPGHTLVFALMQDWKQENLIAPIKNSNKKGNPALSLDNDTTGFRFPRGPDVVRLMLSALPNTATAAPLVVVNPEGPRTFFLGKKIPKKKCEVASTNSTPPASPAAGRGLPIPACGPVQEGWQTREGVYLFRPAAGKTTCRGSKPRHARPLLIMILLQQHN